MKSNLADVMAQYALLYTTLPVQPAAWDHILPVDGAYVAVKRSDDGVDYVMFRGSVTALDWIEDVTRVCQPVQWPNLGPVHPGFLAGVGAVAERLDALVGPRVAIVGHSLGAGHAAIYAGLRAIKGEPVDKLLLFGCPRPGGPVLSALLAGHVPLIQSFRNTSAVNGWSGSEHDMVTDVPFGIPPLLPYEPCSPYISCNADPIPNDPWGLFRWHHFGLYCRALAATPTSAVQSLPGFKK